LATEWRKLQFGVGTHSVVTVCLVAAASQSCIMNIHHSTWYQRLMSVTTIQFETTTKKKNKMKYNQISYNVTYVDLWYNWIRLKTILKVWRSKKMEDWHAYPKSGTTSYRPGTNINQILLPFNTYIPKQLACSYIMKGVEMTF
jgi:hypothetical protein